jgi:hypothetical protein
VSINNSRCRDCKQGERHTEKDVRFHGDILKDRSYRSDERQTHTFFFEVVAEQLCVQRRTHQHHFQILSLQGKRYREKRNKVSQVLSC